MKSALPPGTAEMRIASPLAGVKVRMKASKLRPSRG
jgi:hypothetical protein